MYAKASEQAIAITAVNQMLIANLQLQAGANNGILPAGTKITMHLWFPGTKAQPYIQAYVLGVGVDWPAAGETVGRNVSTDDWHKFEINLATQRAFGQFWSELGLLIQGLPSDFKDTIYLDSVDVVLPPN